MNDFLTQPGSGAPAQGLYSDFASLGALKGQSRDNPDGALGEVASQFEALFVTMMLKAMRATLPEDGLFSGSQMSTYQEMFDQQLALDLSRHNGIGLASLIEKQLAAGQRYAAADAQAAPGSALKHGDHDG
jgi:flagellar protein FlgJ